VIANALRLRNIKISDLSTKSTKNLKHIKHSTKNKQL
jgi:hypothetical protein